jgi:hypothetical protein
MRTIWMQSRCLACLAAFPLLLSPCARAQQPSHSIAASASARPTPAADKAVDAAENEASSASKPSDGSIKVHGHWVLTVKNADGSVADSRDFENQLVTQGTYTYGAQVLVALLSGNGVASAPALGLIQTLNPAPGADDSNECVPSNCTLFTVAGSTLATASYATPGLSAAVNFTAPASVILSGNFQQPGGSAVTFAFVQSFFPICVPNGFSFINQGQLTASGTIGNANTGANGCSGNGALGAGDWFITGPLTFAQITQGGVAKPLTLGPNQTITIVFTLTFS